ncbi:phenol 2-monooxygenase [Kineosporia sp. R_H_3]|uniref:phenol 2-monooxygenase n=1 Tax=Kineosporia sp. R_H_3 TaxID=1961848 RepID=UPI000B4B8FB0|nr:phenol 2-monooxygenase [Kineosporia sp. R_H_3]
MQYELRTQVIEPRRKTFTNLTERYGDRPATRYEEGSVDVQATANFHYRPLWDPTHEIYDPEYSALRLTDPYSFVDPRQFYYAPYVTSRAHLHEAFASTLAYLENRDLVERLPQGWKDLVARAVIPLRHYESGGQLIGAFGCRFGYGTTITQCLSYASFDRVGNAQLLSRLGISLDGGSDGILVSAKQAWMEDADLQPLRKYVELLLVEDDWAAQHVGLDLADQLIYGLLYTHLDETALLGGAGAYSLVAQHLSGWFTDNRRWVDALYAAWGRDPEHGAANKAELSALVARLLPGALEGALGVARIADRCLDAGAVAYVETRARALAAAFAPEES